VSSSCKNKEEKVQIKKAKAVQATFAFVVYNFCE
jgi:hypothetical protein